MAAATVLFDMPMDLDDDGFKYGPFITALRRLFFTHGVSEMSRSAYFLGGMRHVFADVRIRLGEGRFLQVRLKTDNVYYLGFTKGRGDELITEKWYVMNEKPGKPADISVAKANVQSLGYTSSYQPHGIGGYVGTEVSRQGMKEALVALYNYDPKTSPMNPTKTANRMIATALCEPLRYFFLEAKIHTAWESFKPYKFVQDDERFIQGWSNLSKMLRGQDPTTEQLVQWKAMEKAGNANGQYKLEAWNRRQKSQREWNENMDKYCGTYGINRDEIYALLLNENED